MNGLVRVLAAAVAMFIAAPAGAAIVGETAGHVAPPPYKNCTNLNKRYPHGVGKRLAATGQATNPSGTSDGAPPSTTWR